MIEQEEVIAHSKAEYNSLQEDMTRLQVGATIFLLHLVENDTSAQ